jgi:hypothetical protein
MSVGPLASIVVGAPLAQTKGSEVGRAQQESVSQQRQAKSAMRAEAAAGIGEADGQDHETNERDADGRRPWEAPAGKTPAPGETPPEPPQAHGKDASGNSGKQLDLSG